MILSITSRNSLFGSGKMVITGARHKDEILEAVQIIKDELADLL